MKQQKSWNANESDEMCDFVVKLKESGVSQKVAYGRYAALHPGRTARSVESKYQKMLSAKKGGGTGNRELPNKSKKKGTLTLVRYYAKTDNGLETPLGTGTSMDTLLAVINTIENGSGVAQ